MKTKRLLGFALITVVVAVLDSSPAPEAAQAPTAGEPGTASLGEPPTHVTPRARSTESRLASAVSPEAGTDERPRWPDDWPSLDPVRAGGTSGTQTMGIGDIDVSVPPADVTASVQEWIRQWFEGAVGVPTEEEPAEEPTGPDAGGEETPDEPDFFEEGRPVPHVPGQPGFRSVHVTKGRWESQYAPPELVPEIERIPTPPPDAPREPAGEETAAAPPAGAASPEPVGEPPPEETDVERERAPTIEELDRIHERTYRHVAEGEDASSSEAVYPEENGDESEREEDTGTAITSVIDPVVDPSAVGGPSGSGGSSAPVEIVLISNGLSTGPDAFTLYVAVRGEPDKKPEAGIYARTDAERGVHKAPANEDLRGIVNLRTSGLVAEVDPNPDRHTQQRIDQILEASTSGKPLPPPDNGIGGAGPMTLPPEWSGANVYRFEIEAYCLEFAGAVPTEGTFFRIADPQTQAAHEPLRAILRSSRALRDRGQLHPDSDPDSYFHSIRQWAIWIDENNLDGAGFEEAFVEHARKNFAAAGQDWTGEIEKTVRRLAPNRWSDLTAILREAELR